MAKSEKALVVVDQKPETSKPDSKKRYTDAEMKNFLADQKANDWGNGETAEKAGVSEATVRRWKKKFSSSKSSNRKPSAKRPKPRAKKPTAKKSPSVTQLRLDLEAAEKRVVELETELSVLKPFAKYYFK